MERILEGDLARFAVPDLLTFLSLARQTGVLVFERKKPTQETKIFFQEGHPAYASSSLPALRLGEMMVRLGKVKSEDVERLLVKGMAEGLPIGQALVNEKLLDQTGLEVLLRQQVSEVIFDTFEWGAGTFLLLDKVRPPATAVPFEIDMQNLIMEGVRRIDERLHMADAFPDRELVVEVSANPERVRQSATLTPEEWQVYFLVDGRRTIAEIVQMSGPHELETLGILRRLVAASIVAVNKPMALISTARLTPDRPPQEGTRQLFVNPAAVAFPAATPSNARLLLHQEGGETVYPLLRESSIIGRHRNCDVLLPDPKVSAYHARIDRTHDGGFSVLDLLSRNGTSVNGQRIQRVPLVSGDELLVGQSRLVFRVDAAPPVK
jgi:hypothetical protein